MPKENKNIAASVKERLKNIAKQSDKEFQNLLTQYVSERFLFRLSKSIYANNFILKGALLFVAHRINTLRPTRDIDFLGNSISNDNKDIEIAIKQILKTDFNDGIRFDTNSINSESIVEDGNYKGVRIKFFAFLENTKVRLQLDIGFGDKLTTKPLKIDFPTLLDFPSPHISVYTTETAIAEKFEAIVSLQLQTSRMKDFYDIVSFAQNQTFTSVKLLKSITETFKHRQTNISHRTTIFSDDFKANKQKHTQWNAFLNRNKLNTETSFPQIVNKINEFIEPVLLENITKTWDPNKWEWK